MPVKEADPAARSLDEAFAEAMTGPAKPREAAAPPPVDRDAPHGRDEAGEPLSPYGRNKDGSVRKSPAGRKPKDETPRTADGQPAAPAARAVLEPQDFSAALMDAGETFWFAGSVAAKVGPQVPVLGRLIPGARLAATMAVFDAERPRLAMALNLAAQHDARARKLAVKLSSGEAGWALTCMFMVAPFTTAAAAVWQGDEALASQNLPALAELAKRNEDALDRMFKRISAQMEAAQLAQAQALAAQQAADGQQELAGAGA